MIEPVIVRPRKAAEMLSCSIKRLYELLNAGELESFKEGTGHNAARKITVVSIHRYVERKLAENVGSNVGTNKNIGKWQ